LPIGNGQADRHFRVRQNTADIGFTVAMDRQPPTPQVWHGHLNQIQDGLMILTH
jgi:hypothetical protein